MRFNHLGDQGTRLDLLKNDDSIHKSNQIPLKLTKGLQSMRCGKYRINRSSWTPEYHYVLLEATGDRPSKVGLIYWTSRSVTSLQGHTQRTGPKAFGPWRPKRERCDLGKRWNRCRSTHAVCRSTHSQGCVDRHILCVDRHMSRVAQNPRTNPKL